jgi:hypothetical protein
VGSGKRARLLYISQYFSKKVKYMKVFTKKVVPFFFIHFISIIEYNSFLKEENDKETTKNSNFFENLINAFKSSLANF